MIDVMVRFCKGFFPFGGQDLQLGNVRTIEGRNL